jgi:hypothetical protein
VLALDGGRPSSRRRSLASGGAPDTYGELGIRHEDTVVVTESGCENLAPKWSGTSTTTEIL